MFLKDYRIRIVVKRKILYYIIKFKVIALLNVENQRHPQSVS